MFTFNYQLKTKHIIKNELDKNFIYKVKYTLNKVIKINHVHNQSKRQIILNYADRCNNKFKTVETNLIQPFIHYKFDSRREGRI